MTAASAEPGQSPFGDDEEAKARAVHDVVQVASIAAAAVAVQPLPFVDLVVVTPIHVAMVQQIGRIRGFELDAKSVLEILSSIGASLVARSVLMTVTRLVPFVGWAAAVPMAYAMTWSIGEVADQYFRAGRGISPDGMRAMFRATYERRRGEAEARAQRQKGGLTITERLDALARARQAGVIDEAEYEAKKKEILREL